MQFEMTEDEYREYEEEYIGFCIDCGAERDCCEPDACKYVCEACGERKVYGVPELLIMGMITFVEKKRSILNDYIKPSTSGETEEH